MKRTTRKAQGFTLIEIVIVISILAIAMAIAIPAFQRLAATGNLKAAARDIAGDIGNCKQRAVTENISLTIGFNVADNSYTVPQLAGGPLTKRPTYFSSDIQIISAVFSGGALTFQPRGTTQAGSVVLRNNRGSTATITTNITGRTIVQFN